MGRAQRPSYEATVRGEEKWPLCFKCLNSLGLPLICRLQTPAARGHFLSLPWREPMTKSSLPEAALQRLGTVPRRKPDLHSGRQDCVRSGEADMTVTSLERLGSGSRAIGPSEEQETQPQYHNSINLNSLACSSFSKTVKF